MDINNNGYAYAKILFPIGETLDREIQRLRDSFTRVIEQCYPLVIKRKQCIPICVYRDTPIYEWNSIARWGQVLPSAPGTAELITSVLESNVPGELLPCLKTISCENCNSVSGKGRMASEPVRIEITHWTNETKLSVRFSLPSQVNEKKQKQLAQLWSQLQSIWPPLSRFSIGFQTEPDQKKCKVVVENSESGNLCRVEFINDSEVAEQFGFLPILLQKFSEIVSDYSEICILEFNDTNVVAASKFFEERIGAQSYFFYAHPHQGFHPDQLWGETPTEGFWQIPLFKVRPGRHSESSATIFLVQTDCERWFEIQTADLRSRDDLPKYLEQASLPYPIEFWKGLPRERWGLHKLLKK